MIIGVLNEVLFPVSAPQGDDSELLKSKDCRSEECYDSPDYECDEACGCDRALVYNETTGECVLKEYAMLGVIYVYDNSKENIREEAESTFRGIMAAGILFVACATVCALAACLYCCRVNYSDRRLAGDVKALTLKLRRDGLLAMPRTSVKKTDNIAGASCPVVVEEAGIFVA
ncbi:hypothetical protein EVAR_77000_1 [Eumeta japonica]|uniref:Uncharacterized protein n=1 Tax=Eumeta variegata TaxID=151549 RepID=A0A4C1SHD3_EUMVA|nr:hypothetical protein EVAR_77000_1 [Eumeta japonica]